MQKVNEEKFLLDYARLVAKREENLAEIENQARIYAIDRGYDEAKTAQFIAFTKELEGNGLSAEDKTKLEILESYIEEYEEAIVEFDSETTHSTIEKSADATSASVYTV